MNNEMHACKECDELYDGEVCEYCDEQEAEYFHSTWLLDK
jgi:RNA polymerase subunit RPABC4/transcription elongation factor Spt4